MLQYILQEESLPLFGQRLHEWFVLDLWEDYSIEEAISTMAQDKRSKKNKGGKTDPSVFATEGTRLLAEACGKSIVEMVVRAQATPPVRNDDGSITTQGHDTLAVQLLTESYLTILRDAKPSIRTSIKTPEGLGTIKSHYINSCRKSVGQYSSRGAWSGDVLGRLLTLLAVLGQRLHHSSNYTLAGASSKSGPSRSKQRGVDPYMTPELRKAYKDFHTKQAEKPKEEVVPSFDAPKALNALTQDIKRKLETVERKHAANVLAYKKSEDARRVKLMTTLGPLPSVETKMGLTGSFRRKEYNYIPESATKWLFEVFSIALYDWAITVSKKSPERFKTLTREAVRDYMDGEGGEDIGMWVYGEVVDEYYKRQQKKNPHFAAYMADSKKPSLAVDHNLWPPEVFTNFKTSLKGKVWKRRWNLPHVRKWLKKNPAVLDEFSEFLERHELSRKSLNKYTGGSLDTHIAFNGRSPYERRASYIDQFVKSSSSQEESVVAAPLTHLTADRFMLGGTK